MKDLIADMQHFEAQYPVEEDGKTPRKPVMPE